MYLYGEVTSKQERQIEFRWIHGEGAKFSALPEFAVLKKEHADSGKNVTEEIALGGKSPFSAASSKVIMAIMTMKKKAPA
ncbi:MAG: hypothetical protein V1721_02650 [Pseudomonadota bacterium]